MDANVDSLANLRTNLAEHGYSLDTVPYVLARFSEQDMDEMDPALDRAADAAACWAEQGLDTAMNRYNRRNKAGRND